MTTNVQAQNKALMQEIFEQIDRGESSLFYERMADQASMTITGRYSWAQTIKGKERIARDLYGYVHSLLSKRGRTHAYHYLADGDWVVVEAYGDMVTKTGDAYQNHYCLFYKLQDGMIVEMKEYQDSALCERLLGPYPDSLKKE